jgi:polyhydroxybutyrate depolymerase
MYNMRKKSITIVIFCISLLSLTYAYAYVLKGGSVSQIVSQTESEIGDYVFTIKHDRLERRYAVHVPKVYDGTSDVPLVIALHGGGGSADTSPEYFGLNKLSEQEGFIVVYPEGVGKNVLGAHFGSWNAGRCCGDAMKQEVDDVGFIDTMINSLNTTYAIDDSRVYVTGMSNGAQMSYRLACELSDKIAAIAPSGSIGTFDNCKPKRNIPVLHIQGKLDPCSFYDGGTCGGCAEEMWKEFGVTVNANEWSCVAVPEYVRQWKTMNQCSDDTTIIFKNGDATCVGYNGCANGADVVLCTLDTMGHNWAGRDTFGIKACDKDPDGKMCTTWKKHVGPLSQDLDANETIWKFFKEHPMR